MRFAHRALFHDRGRAFVGLASLGWGASILLSVVPHESKIVAAGLIVFGSALLATASSLPTVEGVSPHVAAATGIGLVTVLVTHRLWTEHPMTLPKVGGLLLGIAFTVASLLLHWERQRIPPNSGRLLSTLIAYAFVLVGAPLAVWSVQAGFQAWMGTTPVDIFVRHGLLAPLQSLLEFSRIDPHVTGQRLAFATPRGPMVVDVGAACSGLQAMALFGGVLALFLFTRRPGDGRWAVWSLVGILGVYVANLLRLVFLVLVGYRWGPDALVRAHAEAGWVFFVAWALVFAWIASRRESKRRKLVANI